MPFSNYHTLANLRTENGELFDEQMTFVTVELDKFISKEVDIKTNLEKLIYTMKTLHTVTQPTEFPKFWNEEWLKVAIDELDRRKMTPDERVSFEMLIARNAEAVKAESKRIENVKVSAIQKAIKKNLSIDLIAELNDVSVEFVQKIKQSLIEKQ